MLAPRTSGAFVCLRCRLQTVSFRKTRPVLQRGPTAPFSSASVCSSPDDEGALERQLQSPAQKNNFRLRRQVREKRNGKLYSVESEPLNIASLGTPSEIIVVRDVDRRPIRNDSSNKPELAPDPEQEEGPKHDDLFASWEKENAAPEQDEVNAQIESLRPGAAPESNDPNQTVYLSNAEYRRLSKVLYDGFTGQQLSRYFADSTGIITSDDADKVIQGLIKGSSGNKRPVHQTEWIPGKSPISTRLPGGNAAMLSRASKQKGGNKKLLVDQILRKAWHLTLLEEIEAPGELEISLKRWQLSLLFAGRTPTPLDIVGAKRNAKIEIFWPHNVLRITADKNSAEYAARDVEDLLKSTERFALKLQPWRPFLSPEFQAQQDLTELFTPKDITLVENMAGVIVQPIAKSEFVIRAMNKDQVADAHRSLLAMLPINNQSSMISITKFISESKKKESTFIGSSSKSALDYKYRDLDLVRWTLPVARTESPTGAAVPTPQEPEWISHDKSLLNQVMRSFDRPTPFSPFYQQYIKEDAGKGFISKEPRWSPHPEISTGAQFGHILHPAQSHRSLIAKLNSSQMDTSKAMTVLSNTIPGLSHLLDGLPPRQVNVTNTLEYHFAASPYPPNVLENTSKYPKLVVRVSLEPDGKAKLEGARLDHWQDFTDVLLPDQATDIRFRRRVSSHLYRAEYHERIDSYVKAISQNIKGGGQLSAPPSIKLGIPAWSILTPQNQPLQKIHLDSSATKDMEYIFLGIQHRQSLLIPFGIEDAIEDKMPFKNHTLMYSGVEAGQLGGKFGELALRYSKKNRALMDDTELATRILRHFITTAFRVANRITTASFNQYPFEAKLARKEPLKRVLRKPRDDSVMFRSVSLEK